MMIDKVKDEMGYARCQFKLHKLVMFCKGCKGAALTLRSCARGERLRNTLPLSASSNLSDPAKKGQTLITIMHLLTTRLYVTFMGIEISASFKITKECN